MTIQSKFTSDFTAKVALARYGGPEIFNTDHGSQFTSRGFTGVFRDAGVTISMDGRGRCMDKFAARRKFWPPRKKRPNGFPN